MELSSDYKLLPFAINWKDGSSGYQSRREDTTHGLRFPIPGLGCSRCGWYSQTVEVPEELCRLNSCIAAIQYHIEPVFYIYNMTYVRMTTSAGEIDIQLYTEECPETTNNFLKLVDDGFYDGFTSTE